MTARPLRGAALTTARNSRPLTQDAPVAARLTDQAGLLPETVSDLLHTRGVTVAPDEQRQAVVIVLPLDLANDLIPLCPDPLQAALACRLIESYL